MLEELTVRKAVEFAVKTEEMGGRFYEKFARKFSDDPELKKTFELLARDEKVHENQFLKLLETVPKDEPVSSRDERFHYLRIMSMSQFFMGEGGIYGSFDRIKTREDALWRAFELEKATLQYYQAMKEVLGDDGTLEAIIQAERGHLKQVTRYLLTDAKFRGISDDY